LSAKHPTDPATSPWLHLAAPVGKFGATLLIVSSFTAMFAPIVFLLNAESVLDPDLPASGLIALFSDPARLLAISDFVAILGIVLLGAAVAVVLIGLVRADKPVSAAAFLSGGVVFGCLALWVPLMLYSQGQARGAITTLDAAAATGGWSLASLVLLVATLAYLAFTARIEHGVHHRRLTSYWWPAYAAVNVFGSVAIAGYFARLASGFEFAEALSLGLVLKVTLIPMLGVMAYGDLKDRFPMWRTLHLMDPYKATTVARAPDEMYVAAGHVPTMSGATRKMVLPREPLVGGAPPDEVDGQEPWVAVSRHEPTRARTTVRPRPPV